MKTWIFIQKLGSTHEKTPGFCWTEAHSIGRSAGIFVGETRAHKSKIYFLLVHPDGVFRTFSDALRVKRIGFYGNFSSKNRPGGTKKLHLGALIEREPWFYERQVEWPFQLQKCQHSAYGTSFSSTKTRRICSACSSTGQNMTAERAVKNRSSFQKKTLPNFPTHTFPKLSSSA